jgi:hypothetical protein
MASHGEIHCFDLSIVAYFDVSIVATFELHGGHGLVTRSIQTVVERRIFEVAGI